MKTFLQKTQLATTLVAMSTNYSDFFMKKLRGLITFAASVVLTCCLFYSCSSDDDIVPSTTDSSVWSLTQYMDTLNYRAGDNFFMFCNGRYWNTTELEPGVYAKGFMYNETTDIMNERIAQTDMPSIRKLWADTLNYRLTDEEIDFYMTPVMQQIDAAVTHEDCYRLFAQLYLKGYKTFNLTPFCVNGIFKAQIEPLFNYTPDSGLKWSAPRYTEEALRKHPELTLDLLPYHQLMRSTGSTAFDIILNELGIEAGDVYMAASVRQAFDDYEKISVAEFQDFLKSTVQLCDAPYMSDEGVTYANSVYYQPFRTFYDYMIEAEGTMNYTKSYYFASKWVTQDMKDDIRGKCEELRSVLRSRITNLAWMSETTKERAINKLNKMVFNIGCPETWITEGLVDNSQCKTLVEDVRLARQAAAKLNLAIIGTSREENSMTAIIKVYSPYMNYNLTITNAFYDSTTNSINIYPVFMMAPWYSRENHDAINYANFTVFGHEIIHGFDSSGANYDEVGDFRNWWTIQDKMDFEEQLQLLIDCYDQLELLPGDPNLDASHAYSLGEPTLSENVADLGGISLTHQAFVEKCQREGYYGEELDKQERKFYQAYANVWRQKYEAVWVEYCYSLWKAGSDHHSMAKERINGVVMNCDRWYELYNVQWGDHLYLRPEKRSHIW